MRKTININLGGMAFIIDENAYELLHNYLEAVKRKFGNAAERDEIMSDIEARIAEMLQQKMANRKEVVSIEEVQPVINLMGKPEDIAGEEPAEPATTPVGAPKIYTSKRLFRDTDDSVVGGVISGLSHYFGINDPIWLRVAAAILIPITAGNIILLYLLLLIIVPKANTAAEKLQMRGEPININTIEKEVRDAAGRAGESIKGMVRGSNFFERAWDVIVSLVKGVAKAAAVFVIAGAMIGLFFTIVGFTIFYLLGTSSYTEITNMVVDNPSTITLLSFGFLLTAVAPIVAIIYVGLRILFGRRSQVRWLKWSLLGAWILGIIMLAVSGFRIGTNFKSQSTRNEQVALAQPGSGSLLVQLADTSGQVVKNDEDETDDFNLDIDGMYFNGVNFRDMSQIPFGEPSLQLMPSENDSFYFQKIISSQGRNRKDADKNIDMVIYHYSQKDSVLNLSPQIFLSKDAKIRGQYMKIRIAVPEGKKVRFGDNIDHWPATVKGNSKYDDTQFANTVWTVEGGVVKCIEGENHRGDDDSGNGRRKDRIKVRVKNAIDIDDNSNNDESDKDF